MKNKNILWWGLGGIIVIGLVVWTIIGIKGLSNNSVVSQNSPEPIKIGFIGPLTGGASSFGVSARAAIQVSVSEVNQAGGINGRPIKMIYEDGQCNAKDAVNAARKLININHVSAILGGVCSTETSAFVNIAMKNKTIVFSPCSSAPSLSNSGKYFFRDYPSDSYQGSYAANYAYNKLGARRVAILYHISAYGTGIKDVFVKRFKELGGTILDIEGVPQTTIDYRSQLTKIKELNPDLIYSPMYPGGSIAALTQANQLGIKTTFLGADGWGDLNLQKKVSGKGKFLYTSVSSPNLSKNLKQKILAVSGETGIPACSTQAYSAVQILANALKQVGTNPNKLAKALHTTNYNGVSGHISFDKNGDLTNAKYVIKQIKNGSFVLVN